MEILFLSKGKLYQVMDRYIVKEIHLQESLSDDKYHAIEINTLGNGMPEKFIEALKETLEAMEGK